MKAPGEPEMPVVPMLPGGLPPPCVFGEEPQCRPPIDGDVVLYYPSGDALKSLLYRWDMYPELVEEVMNDRDAAWIREGIRAQEELLAAQELARLQEEQNNAGKWEPWEAYLGIICGATGGAIVAGIVTAVAVAVH